MNFTFKQLEAFLFSTKLQSFSAAAVKLHTTQSAISKRLAELEESLGGTLLHRTSHGLELAQAGRELLPLAEANQITLGVEPEPSNVVASARKARRLLDESPAAPTPRLRSRHRCPC